MRLLFGFVATIVPFVLQYNYILNLFYHIGAVYFDAGLLANLIWHNDGMLGCSEFYGQFPFLVVHFSPLLLVINQLSYFVTTYKVEFFAAFVACLYASFSAAMYYTLLVYLRPQRPWQMAGLAALAVAIGFNGIVVQGIWMPHFEFAMPTGILLFLLHHRLGNKAWAMFFFVLTLSVREDAGFHIAVVLGLLICMDYARMRSLRASRREILFLLVAFCYSLTAWWLTFRIRTLYGAEGSVFSQIYTGNPPYAHLSWDVLTKRLRMMFAQRVYLWLAFLIVVGWTCVTRNLYWIIGFAASLPWFLLNWASANDNSGTLYAYYAFPFVIGMGWPAIAGLWRYGAQPSSADVRRQVLVMQVMLAAAGLLVWDPDGKHIAFGPVFWEGEGSYRLLDGEESREAVRRFADVLGRSGDLGTVMADAGMSSLTVGSVLQNQGRSILWRSKDTPVNTVVYMNPSDPMNEDLQYEIANYHLTAHYCVINTTICFFSDRRPEQLGVFASMVVEKPITGGR